MSAETDHPKSSPVRLRGTGVLALIGALAFFFPPFGFVGSLLTPLFAARTRGGPWPRVSPITIQVCATLVVVGLWLPAALSLVSGGQVGSAVTAWLIIPLCAPSGWALLVPAVLAIGVYLTGLTISTIARHPWPWVVGAAAAPWVYEAAARWLVSFECIA